MRDPIVGTVAMVTTEVVYGFPLGQVLLCLT